jgi:GTP pyrophosphokinase
MRALIIKLADRTDNMRSLQFIANDQKRTRIARETMEIFVPLANLLGIGEIRAELEDLSFQHLHAEEYAALKREIEENIDERNFILDEMIRLTEKEIGKNKMEAEILGRPKTLYSIFKKLETKHSLHNIDDIIAIRIIVPSKKDCYQTLGIVHKLFKPTSGRIKDYIAVPKPNGYQSIHTTVFGINGSMVEFQIRTRYMHLEAEYGIAAHYFYKTNKSQELNEIMRQRSNWVQKILDIQKDQKDPHDFMHDLKLDIFQDRIFVFSPKGDVIDLPRGACVIDFAYAIHGDVGHHAARAEINGIVSSIMTTLGSGDTVKVITNGEAIPEREWLSHAKTSLAVNKIKDFL